VNPTGVSKKANTCCLSLGALGCHFSSRLRLASMKDGSGHGGGFSGGGHGGGFSGGGRSFSAGSASFGGRSAFAGASRSSGFAPATAGTARTWSGSSNWNHNGTWHNGHDGHFHDAISMTAISMTAISMTAISTMGISIMAISTMMLFSSVFLSLRLGSGAILIPVSTAASPVGITGMIMLTIPASPTGTLRQAPTLPPPTGTPRMAPTLPPPLSQLPSRRLTCPGWKTTPS
jgi:hypothetical protein